MTGVMTCENIEYHLYPPFFTDYVAFIVRKEDEQMSLTDLVTLIGCNIWIGLSFCVILVNCCFLLIYYQNPRLQRSIKVRTKVMSKVINIISLHGLTFFQSEWQQGPTVSSKWILFTYNIMFLIFSGIYTILYTQKIFSLKKLTPFDEQNILNNTFAYTGTAEFIFHLLAKYCPVMSDYCDTSCIRKFNQVRHVGALNKLLEKLQNGKFTAVVEVAANAFKELKRFPEIGIVGDIMVPYGFSFRSNADFDFVEIFDAITLKMREIGVMNKLFNMHFDFKHVPESVLNPVSFALVWYLMVVLGVGIVISLIVCLIENFIWRLSSRTTRRDKIIATL